MNPMSPVFDEIRQAKILYNYIKNIEDNQKKEEKDTTIYPTDFIKKYREIPVTKINSPKEFDKDFKKGIFKTEDENIYHQIKKRAN